MDLIIGLRLNDGKPFRFFLPERLKKIKLSLLILIKDILLKYAPYDSLKVFKFVI
jgi:hypothetical protein